MTDKIISKLKVFIGRIPEKKKPFVIIIVGIIIMLFLILPEYTKSHKTELADSDNQLICNEEYKSTDIEEELIDLISSIKGAGSTKVMVTYETSEENVYARDINAEKNEYVVIKTGSDETGMLLKVIKPKIRGVAIVCEGGDLPTVKIAVTDAVCSLLGISSNKISISKMKDRSD